tara:strand:- start:73 stop:666 length:594 start_codon:yes stop_codon:yes gene_type:complete
MAVPSSGELSLKGIANEIDDNDYTSDGVSGAISLKDLSDGSVDTINTNNGSGYRPDGSTPHSMSEWYTYNHDNDNTTSWSSVPGDFSMSVQGLTPTTANKTIKLTNASGDTTIQCSSDDVGGFLRVAASTSSTPSSGHAQTATITVPDGNFVTIFLQFELSDVSAFSKSDGTSVRDVTFTNNSVQNTALQITCTQGL